MRSALPAKQPTLRGVPHPKFSQLLANLGYLKPAQSLSATISPTSPRPTDGGWSRPNARARHELVKPEDASYRPIQETLPSPLGMGDSLFESGPPELKTRSFVPLSSSPSSVCSVPVRRPVASRSASASRSTPQSPEFGPAATQAELENLELKFSLLPPAEQRASAKVMKPAQTGTACSTQPRAVRLVCRPGHDASAWHPAQTPVFRPQCQRWRNQ